MTKGFFSILAIAALAVGTVRIAEHMGTAGAVLIEQQQQNRPALAVEF